MPMFRGDPRGPTRSEDAGNSGKSTTKIMKLGLVIIASGHKAFKIWICDFRTGKLGQELENLQYRNVDIMHLSFVTLPRFYIMTKLYLVLPICMIKQMLSCLGPWD